MRIKTFQIVYDNELIGNLIAEEVLEDLREINGEAVLEVHEINHMKEQEEIGGGE